MEEEIKIDAKRLIAEVYKRSALWNQKDVLYHNRDVTKRIWMELSTLLGLPKAVLKAKWKGLRDTFRAEIKKEQMYHKNKFPRPKSGWIHYKRLQFLKEQMLPRPPIWERENCNDQLNNKKDGETISSMKNIQSTRMLKPRVAIKVMPGRKSSSQSIARKTTTTLPNTVSCISNDNDSCIVDIKNENKEITRLKSSSTTISTLRENTTHVNNILTTAPFSTEKISVNNPDDVSNNDHHHQTIVVKSEPVEEIIENMEFENGISSELTGENEMILQTISPEQVLMTNNIGETCEAQHIVDPLEGNRLDDNYYFLMSLLPHIKTLPAERRMLLRMQMQELVYKEVYKKE